MQNTDFSNLIQKKNANLKLMASALRVLSVDMVEAANSGHPGMPLGIADVLTVLFTKFICLNIQDPKWSNRDRFILSAGHGCAILYALFYLLGYEDINLNDLKNFRQLYAKTAGHPEYGFLNAIEVTTGPLGQGIANGVGIAIGEKILRERYGNEVINHKTFVLGGDGCFMEGISSEAMSLAGHLGLSNLIYIYDKNNITIDGKLSLCDTTDFIKRFESAGFNVFTCNGHNYDQIEESLNLAVSIDNGKPSIIIAETKIGYGSPTKEGSEKSHGAPLGKEDISSLRATLEMAGEPFFLKEEALALWRKIPQLSLERYNIWQENLQRSSLRKKFLNDSSFLNIQENIIAIKEEIFKNREAKATRQHSSFVLSRLIEKYPNLIGGSADLSESNGVKTKNSHVINRENFTGNFLHYGIREHAMAAITNALTIYGNFRAYCSTFLVFADYMRPAIRLAALMKISSIFILTHDSVAVGEDGPTHQPVEHLTSLRIIPNLKVIRPADSLETAEAWEIALLSEKTPVAIILSRQVLQERTPLRRKNFSSKGAYFAFENEKAKIALYATGSEVSLAFEVKDILASQGIFVNIVSMPCLELFELQEREYKRLIMDFQKRIFIEAGIKGLFNKYLEEDDLFFGVEAFGEGGKSKDVMDHFGLSANNIASHILSKL